MSTDPASTEISPLPLHDALPISGLAPCLDRPRFGQRVRCRSIGPQRRQGESGRYVWPRSETASIAAISHSSSQRCLPLTSHYRCLLAQGDPGCSDAECVVEQTLRYRLVAARRAVTVAHRECGTRSAHPEL